MRGRFTDIEVSFGEHAEVLTFRDGLLVRWKLYRSKAQGLRAVGLAG